MSPRLKEKRLLPAQLTNKAMILAPLHERLSVIGAPVHPSHHHHHRHQPADQQYQYHSVFNTDNSSARPPPLRLPASKSPAKG